MLCAPALRGESFGIVLLEGMASGATVVASDIDGYRNVASNGDDALLVPPGDPMVLGEALRRAIEDVELCDRLRAGGKIRAGQFSMESLADAYLQRYQRLLG